MPSFLGEIAGRRRVNLGPARSRAFLGFAPSLSLSASCGSEGKGEKRKAMSDRSVPPGRRAFRRLWRERRVPPPRTAKTEEEDMAELCSRHAVNASRMHWKSDATAWLERRNAAIAPELTAARQAQLRQLYRVIDADGSGELDYEELDTALRLCGYTKQSARGTITDMFRELGKDLDTGVLNFSEFCRMVTASEARAAQQRRGAAGGGVSGAGGGSSEGISFGVMLRTFQRKRLLEEMLAQ